MKRLLLCALLLAGCAHTPRIDYHDPATGPVVALPDPGAFGAALPLASDELLIEYRSWVAEECNRRGIE